MDLDEQLDEAERLIEALRDAVDEEASIEALQKLTSELSAWTYAMNWLLTHEVVMRDITQQMKSLGFWQF